MSMQPKATSRMASFAYRVAATTFLATILACADDASPTRPMEPAPASAAKNSKLR